MSLPQSEFSFTVVKGHIYSGKWSDLQAYIPLSILQSNSKFAENYQRCTYSLKNTGPITAKYCTHTNETTQLPCNEENSVAIRRKKNICKCILIHRGGVRHPKLRTSLLETSVPNRFQRNLNQNTTKVQKVDLKMESAKWWPFCISLNVLIDLLFKSTVHRIIILQCTIWTEMCTHVHISVTKWWDICPMHCGICDMELLVLSIVPLASPAQRLGCRCTDRSEQIPRWAKSRPTTHTWPRYRSTARVQRSSESRLGGGRVDGKSKDQNQAINQTLKYQTPIWFGMASAFVFVEVGKPFVQPNFVPPLAGY